MSATWPVRTLDGDTVTESRLLTPTATGGDEPAPPRSSNASATMVCQPAGAFDHTTLYGSVVSLPMLTPSAKKSTRATVPSESVAAADRVMGVERSTIVPLRGAVTVTTGTALPFCVIVKLRLATSTDPVRGDVALFALTL